MSNIDEIKLTSDQLFSEFKTLLLTPDQVAKLVHRTEGTLKADRDAGRGIKVTKHKHGVQQSKVYYSINDVAAYIVGQKGK